MREKNLIDRLLETDVSKLERPSKNIKINRLSKIFGFDFELTIKTMPSIVESNINEQTMKLNSNGDIDIDTRKLQNMTIVESCFVDNKQFFKNKELMKKFNVSTPFDLVEKILTSGERSKIHDAYQQISGYNNDSVTIVETLKN